MHGTHTHVGLSLLLSLSYASQKCIHNKIQMTRIKLMKQSVATAFNWHTSFNS